MDTTQPMRPRAARGLFRAVLVWPIKFAWRMATFTVNRMGILLGLVFGLGLILLGWLLCSTLLGIIIGLPMVLCGLFILLRALY